MPHPTSSKPNPVTSRPPSATDNDTAAAAFIRADGVARQVLLGRGGRNVTVEAGDDNTLFKSNTGFRYDILGSLYTSVSLRYDYETEPAPGAKSYDATLAVGLGAEF